MCQWILGEGQGRERGEGERERENMREMGSKMDRAIMREGGREDRNPKIGQLKKITREERT